MLVGRCVSVLILFQLGVTDSLLRRFCLFVFMALLLHHSSANSKCFDQNSFFVDLQQDQLKSHNQEPISLIESRVVTLNHIQIQDSIAYSF